MAPPPHQPHGGRAVSGSERLYRALLAAYPKEFRRAHGREMAQVFRCMCREKLVSGGRGGLARLWVRTLWELLATALAERTKKALEMSTLVGSSSKLVRGGGLAATAGGALLIAYGVLMWVKLARWGGLDSGSPPPEEALLPIFMQEIGYLLFIGGLAGLVGLLERARQARPRQAGSAARNLSLARCSAVAGLVLVGLAAAANVAGLVQLSTVGIVTIGGTGGVPRGSFVDVALGVATWLMLWGLPLGIVLLGMAVLGSGLLGRWKALPLAVGLLMSPLGNLLIFLPAPDTLVFHLLARLARLLRIRGAQRDRRHELGAAGVGASIGPPRVDRPYRHPARAKEGRGMARRTLCTPLTIAAAALVACSVALLLAVSGGRGLLPGQERQDSL